MKTTLSATILAAALLVGGCGTLPRAGKPEPRKGDEIVAAGQFFHTGTRVVLWLDPGGYDAYRVERRFAPIERIGLGKSRAEVTNLTNAQPLWPARESLDGRNKSKRCAAAAGICRCCKAWLTSSCCIMTSAARAGRVFEMLQDDRGLSVHFLLDLDGTIYQTLDLKERAWHATTSNDRSVGVEIANIGAFPADGENPFAQWYQTNADGQTYITIPKRLGDGGIRTPNFTGHPARNEPVSGAIQGEDLVQYDYTPEQYAALTN